MKKRCNRKKTPGNRRIFVARVNLEPRLDGYEITSLCVSKYQRGKGYGSEILRKVIDAADAEGVPLYIVARPFDGSPMTRLEIVAWYQRAGFTGKLWGFQKREANVGVPLGRRLCEVDGCGFMGLQ